MSNLMLKRKLDYITSIHVFPTVLFCVSIFAPLSDEQSFSLVSGFTKTNAAAPIISLQLDWVSLSTLPIVPAAFSA